MKKIHLIRMTLYNSELMYCGLQLFSESFSNRTDDESWVTCKTCLKAARR